MDGSPSGRAAMGAIALLARRGLRRNWGGWALVSLLIAATLSMSGGAAGVAQETVRAHPRLLDAVDAPDLTMGIGNPDEPGPPAPIAVDDLRSVEGIARIAVMRGTIGTRVDAQGHLDLTGGTALSVATEGVPALPLVRGRMPAADAADEVTISLGASDALGADVGDRIRYAVLTPAELMEISASGADRGGTTVEPIVVGVYGPVGIEGPPGAPTSGSGIIAGPAFLAAHPGVGTYRLAGIWLEDGATLDSVLRSIEERFGAGLDLSTRAQVESDARQAAQPEAIGALGLAMAAALAGLIIIIQAIARQMNDGQDETVLLALGLGRRLRATQRWAQAAVAIAAGTAFGLVGALAITERLGPIGIASAFDLPGTERAALAITVGVCLALTVSVAVVANVSAWRGSRIERRLPSPAPTWVAAVLSSAPLALRTGAALGSRGTGARRAVRAAVVGMATSVTVILTVITFSSSLDALVSTPALYGKNYDLAAWDGYGAVPDDAITDGLEGDPGVAAVSRSASSGGTVNGREAGLVGLDDPGVGPRLTSGAQPSADDEVLLGRRLARRLGLGIGDDVSVVIGAGRQTYRVVGLGVTPDDVGDGAAFTLEGIRRVAPDAEVGTQYVRLRSGADAEAVVDRFVEGLGCHDDCELVPPTPPTSLAYLNAVGALPRWSVGTVIAVGVAMAIHALLIVGRQSRRSIAVLRSLGASRSQVTRYLLSQTMLIVATAAVTGVVAGLVVGRAVWSLFAGGIGVVPDATTSTAAAVASVGALAIVATAAAAVSARRTAHRPIVPELRAD